MVVRVVRLGSPRASDEGVATPSQWAAFKKRYRSEMASPEAARTIELLAVLSHHANFSVGCYCEQEDHCHRSVLRELLLEQSAQLAPPE